MKIPSFLKDGIPTLRPEDLGDTTIATLIDVRSAEEYVGELGHIDSAVLATLGPELEAHLSKLDKTKPVIFICRSGARSGRATQYALDAGFAQVYNLEGGMIKWNQLGKPISK